MNEYKLSTKEATALIVNLLCSKLFLLCTSDFTKISGSGAIISVLFVYGLEFLFFSFYIKNNNTKNILDRINSSFVKKIFSLLTVMLLIFSGSVSLNLLVYFSKMTALLNSPLSFLTLPFAVCMIFAAGSGLKCIGKLNGFFVPLLYVTLFTLLVFSYNSFDFTNLTPIFGKGFINVFGKSFFLLSNLFEFLILLYIPQNIKGSFKKTGFSALIISLAIYIVTICSFLLIGGKTSDLPLLSVIQSGAFRRTDSIFLLLYSLSGMLYLSTLLYFAIHIFCFAFKINEKKALLLPFALILISFSSINFFNSNGKEFLSLFSRWLWIFPVALPLIFTFFKEKQQ